MKTKRIFYAVIGVIVMFFAGFIYSWSVLASFIAADFPAWSSGALSLTFTICMAFFCLGGLAGGMLSKKIPVRFNIMISAVFFLVGFFIASRTQSLGGLYVSYGVLGGAASGFAYNGVLNVLPRWFPGNHGLISGILLMGFGASSLVIGSLFTMLTPATEGGWRTSFLFMGVLIAAILLVCSLFIVPPKEDEVLSLTANASSSAANDPGRTVGASLTTGQMLRQPSFWLFWVWGTLLSGVGLAVISQAKPIVMLVSPQLGAGIASLIVGMISVCNGLGRIITGGIFDKFGYKTTMLVVNALSLACLLVLIFALFINAFPLVVVAFLGIGIGYGGCPTSSASVTRLFFGQKNYPVNLSIMNMNLLVASFFGTIAGVLYDRSGGYMAAIVVLAVCSAVALMIRPLIRRPESVSEVAEKETKTQKGELA